MKQAKAMISIVRNLNFAGNCNGFLHSSWIRGGRFMGVVHKRFKSYRPSYVHGAGSKAMLGATIGHFVDIIPESAYADSEAMVDCHQGIRKTFLQYKDDIDKLAMGFLSLNLNRGDRIGIWLPNRYEWAVMQLAAAKSGLIMVTLNPAYQVPELEYCLKKLSIRCMVIQENFKTQEYYKMMTKIIPEIADTKPSSKVKSAKHPYFDTLIMTSEKSFPGAFKYADVMQAGGDIERLNLKELQRKIQFDDPVNVQFTSGTTGAPKAATLSHHGLINGSYVLTEKLGYDKQIHRLNAPVPLFHTLGCVGVILASIIFGNTAVLPAQNYDPGRILRSIEEEMCTTIFGSPTIYIDMFNHPNFSKTNFSSIQRGVISGAPCPPYLIKKIMEEMHCPGLIVVYGSTEISGLFVNFPEDPIEEKMYSCGRIYDYMEAKITDKNGNIVPIGTEGEICARGYRVMLGYWGDEEKTKEVITPDGWYKTGDIGILNENGTLQVKERMKDLIIRGGENIYPREIEDLLISHPKIAETQVIGVPDERFGEEVCVWIRLKENQAMEESEVEEFCKGTLNSVDFCSQLENEDVDSWESHINVLKVFVQVTSKELDLNR